jgi:uncharacterized protein with GYD domain
MPTYIQLLTLNQEGRRKVLDDPSSVLRAQAEIAVPGIQVLGLYGVLGNYDFVNIVEADDNDAIARFSLELGVSAGAHVTTLPAIPVGRLAQREGADELTLETEVSMPQPEEAPGELTR